MNRARRSTALMAAYAVALAALLPALTALLPGKDSAPWAVICSAGTPDALPSHGLPAKAPPCPDCGACAIAGCGPALLTRADAALSRVLAAGHATPIAAIDFDIPGPVRLAGHHFARAPPAA